ncbi:hypothetical protein HYS47_00050 [Candidatus Woesearchaeota archaeon]|nr:hypothetical protein [Candidatus Woesearchaeota archaeon]
MKTMAKIITRIRRETHRPVFMAFLTLFLILLVLGSILLMTGCQTLRSGRGVKERPLHTGTEALSFSFIQGTLPKIVSAPEQGHEGIPFTFSITMENKGASDIINGYFALALEEGYLQFSEWDFRGGDMNPLSSGERVTFRIQGRTEDNPFGQQHAFSATVVPLPLGLLEEQHSSTIILTACYDYKTAASAEICIDTDVQGLYRAEKPCTGKPVLFSGGQGGPVSVTHIEQTMARLGEDSLSPRFTITVKNVGKGEVVSREMIEEACSSSPSSLSLRSEDINQVTLENVAFSGFTLEEGEIICDTTKSQLRNGEAKFRCRLQRGLMSATQETYLTTMTVEMSYGYTHSISSPVTLERTLY